MRRALLRGPGDGAAGDFGLVELAGRLPVVFRADRRVILGKQRNRVEADQSGKGSDVAAGVEIAATQ